MLPLVSTSFPALGAASYPAFLGGTSTGNVTPMAPPIVALRALSLTLCCAVALSACGDPKKASKDRDKDEDQAADEDKRPSLTMDDKFGLFMKENTELADAIEREKSATGAVKIWDARKESLKKRYDSIKDARGFQVTEETKTKFGENVTECMTKVCLKVSLDAAEAATFKKLCDDYTTLFELGGEAPPAGSAATGP